MKDNHLELLKALKIALICLLICLIVFAIK